MVGGCYRSKEEIIIYPPSTSFYSFFYLSFLSCNVRIIPLSISRSLASLSTTCCIIIFTVGNIFIYVFCSGYEANLDEVQSKTLLNESWMIIFRGPDCLLATWFVVEHLSLFFLFSPRFATDHPSFLIVLSF